MEWALTIVALALLGVAAVSKRISGTPITPAILFVSIGLLVGPKVIGAIDVESTSATVPGRVDGGPSFASARSNGASVTPIEPIVAMALRRPTFSCQPGEDGALACA